MSVRAQILAGALGVSAGALPIPGAVEGVPPRALQAYVQAASSPEACAGMRWSVLAAVYRRESGHGTSGGADLDSDGVASPAIYGPPIDWLVGVRAEGPGQFLPSSWAAYGDGDPQDIDDAAMATVRHLCGTHGDVEGAHLRSAIVSYYGADRDGYADSVLEDVAHYDRVAPVLVDEPGKDRTPERLADQVWDITVLAWVRAGDAARAVGLGGAWRAADDALFGRLEPQRAAHPDGLAPEFGRRLDAMIAAAPGSITVLSGRRTPAEQLELWQRYQAGVGNPADWSDGVTCASRHCTGEAADLTYGPGMQAWAHANAAAYHLAFVHDHEPWHIEQAG